MPRTKKSAEEKQIEKPVWLKYTKEEVEAIILKLANKGMTTEKIGLVLRDQYGIPKVKILGIKIKEVLKERANFEEPTILNLRRRIEKIEEHYKKNKGDKKAERSLIITKSRLKKREKYKDI